MWRTYKSGKDIQILKTWLRLQSIKLFEYIQKQVWGEKKLTHTKESRQKYQTDVEKINCKRGKKGKQNKK